MGSQWFCFVSPIIQIPEILGHFGRFPSLGSCTNRVTYPMDQIWYSDRSIWYSDVISLMSIGCEKTHVVSPTPTPKLAVLYCTYSAWGKTHPLAICSQQWRSWGATLAFSMLFARAVETHHFLELWNSSLIWGQLQSHFTSLLFFVVLFVLWTLPTNYIHQTN